MPENTPAAPHDSAENAAIEAPVTATDTDDRVQPVNQQSQVCCPLCPVPMVGAKLDSAAVLHCQECGGVLVPTDVFAHVIASRRVAYRGAEAAPSSLDVNAYRRQLNCPICKQRMETHPYYGPGNVVIDSCAACQFIWVDQGELAAIERAPGTRLPPPTTAS